MNLKPIYDTGTITFVESPERLKLKKIDSTYIKDPKGVIPNGIYKVFKHEKHKQIFLVLFFFSLILLISTIALLSSFKMIKNVHWFWQFVLYLLDIGLFVKTIFIVFDTYHLKKSITMYREALIAGSRLTPPFVSNIYKNLFIKQTKQNWIVLATVFYGIIFLLLFWILKDFEWWIFKFKTWIKNVKPNPVFIESIGITILVLVVFFHIYYTIYRKKRMIDIQFFFGNEVISQVEIDRMIKEKSKFYCKIFFLSILTILVIPFLVFIIIKKIRK